MPGKATDRPAATPSGLPLADAQSLVTEAAGRLWTPEGEAARDYLHRRGLTDATIRAARLGWTPRAIGVAWKPPGVVIPWHTDGRLSAVKIRPPDKWRLRFAKDKRPPKYIWGLHGRSSIFPDPAVIEPGRPLIITEGEFDALLLGQALGDMAAVVTLGSASNRPEAATRFAMLAAPVWYLAHDADPAGDKAALGWPARAIRVRPPCFIMPEAGRNTKDWSDLHANGVDLARWWRDRLAGTDAPELFTWDELSTWRWGDSIGDPEPGIVIDKPDRGRMLAALKARVDDLEERKVIQSELC
jgi:hypothetical protein